MAMYNEELLSWSDIQSDILTGANSLQQLSKPEKDFKLEDSPYYYKQAKTCTEAFSNWIKNGNRSDIITGAWNRAFFIGGWNESGNWDTFVYNLQTPSLFVDIRIPISRPDFSSRSGFDQLSLDELRALSRQGCTAGSSIISGQPPIVTKHHAVDWNYHPDFSTPHPNRWRLDVHPEGNTFKEISLVNDSFGQAICLQRWERLDQSDGPFLALKKLINPASPTEGILCVTGNHFAFAMDRAEPLPLFPNSESGGCSALVDDAWIRGDRKSIVQMLSLSGCYGNLATVNHAPWTIVKSTIPWLENTPLITQGQIKLVIDAHNNPVSLIWKSETWEIFECSFTLEELHKLLLVDLTSKL
jgi:hypothetical protein